MKRIIALLLLTTPVHAGGWAEPVYEPQVIRPMPRPADLCERPVRSQRTGEVLYYTDRCRRTEVRDPTPARPDRPTEPERPGTPDRPTDPGNKPERPAGQNPGNDKPVGKSPFDGERGEVPSGKERRHE